MNHRTGHRRRRMGLALLGGGLLFTSSCGMGLRDAAVEGASLFLTQFTYTILSGLSPVPLEPLGGGGGGGDGDPFDNPPVQE